MRGHFAAASVEPKAKLAEFRVSADNMIDVGAEITVEHFVAGAELPQRIAVTRIGFVHLAAELAEDEGEHGGGVVARGVKAEGRHLRRTGREETRARRHPR